MYFFGSGPMAPTGNALVDRYPIPELDIGGASALFRLDGNISINNRVITHSVALEMLDKLALPRGAAFASQFDFANLKECFAISLM